MKPLDWLAVRKRMIDLETEHGADHAPVGEVTARMLGVPHSDEFDQGLQREINRANELGTNWYAQLGLTPTVPNVLAIGMLQGVTLASAVHDGKGADLRQQIADHLYALRKSHPDFDTQGLTETDCNEIAAELIALIAKGAAD